jgi:hypothetical protein
MKKHGGIGKITPVELLNEGKNWLKMWESASGEIKTLLPATYCLFTALELHMKAYLVLRNNEYSDVEKLKNDLKHKFKIIYEKLVASGTNSLINEIGIEIKKYELEDIKLDTLKYPENGQAWSLNHGIEKGEHTLVNIFKKIDSEITSNFDQWLITTYPKQTEVSAMVQIGYKGNPEDIDLKKLSNTCSQCLPSDLIIFEDYNYYWRQERIPPRTCLLCKNLFDPNGMRPSILKS